MNKRPKRSTFQSLREVLKLDQCSNVLAVPGISERDQSSCPLGSGAEEIFGRNVVAAQDKGLPFASFNYLSQKDARIA